MELFIFFSLAFALPFIFIRKRTDSTESVLDKKTSLFIKGILCIFVMFHNLSLDYIPSKFGPKPYTGILWILDRIAEHTGGIAVGIFFFLSAYGLTVSYRKQGNKFLKKLLLKNFIKLWLIAIFINFLEYILFFKGSFETKDAILRILNLDLFNNFNRINRHGWFIASILAFYIIFAIVFFACSFLKTDKKIYISGFIVAAIVLIFKLLSMIFDNGGMYTRELTGLAVGIIYALYQNQINNFCKKYFLPITILSSITYICCLFHYEPAAMWALCILIVTLLQKFTFKNKVIEYFGKICVGVYLFLHLTTLILNPYFIDNVWLWMALNSLFIIALAIVLDFAIIGISKFIKIIVNKTSKKQTDN